MQQPALFVTAWLPTETDWTRTAGIARRQRLLIDALKSLGMPIEVLLYVSDKRFDGTEMDRLRIQAELSDFWQYDLTVTVCRWQTATRNPSIWNHYFAPAINYLRHRDFLKFTGREQVNALGQCLARSPSLVVFHHMQTILPLLAGGLAGPAAFLDLDDVEHTSFRRRINEPPVWPGKYLEYLQIPAIVFGEWRAISLARRTFVCSDHDASRLNKLFHTNKVMTLPNAVAMGPKAPPSQRQTLLMLGHYSFAPNRLGAEYFLAEVWDLIQRQIPSAQLVIAGAGPEAIRQFNESPVGVSFTGYVNDLDLLYAETRAVVCPILSGGGTRLKVMEAAAYGRPIVSTRIGAEGIDLKDGSEILLVDTPQTFADACVKLLTDYPFAVKMGSAAQQCIERQYGRDQTIQRLAALFEQQGQHE